MCIIIAKNAGVEPLDEGYFERAWNHNGDGGGIVWKSPDNEDAHVQKGFMKKEDMLAKLKEINKKENSFIAHFRIKSVGDVKPENTHPFVMDKVTFAHNGTITSLRPLEGKTDSETFGLTFLKSRSMKWIKENQLLLELALGSSKFAIMDNKTGEIVILNKENGKEQDGAWFSNGSADEVKVITTRSNYDYDFYDYNRSFAGGNNNEIKARRFFGTTSYTTTFCEYVKDAGCWCYSQTKRPMSTFPFTDDVVVSRNGMYRLNKELQPTLESYPDFEKQTYKKKCPEYKIIATMQRELQHNLAEYWKMSFSDTDEREEFELDLSAQNLVLDAARRFIRNSIKLDYCDLTTFVFDNLNMSNWVGRWQRTKGDLFMEYAQDHINSMFGIEY